MGGQRWRTGGLAALVFAALAAAASAGCGDDDGGGGQGAATSGGTGGAGGGTGGGGTTGTGGAGTTGSGGDPTGTGGGTTASTGTSMGSPCSGSTCDLTVIGQGFSAHDGMMVYAGIVPQGGQDFDWMGSAEVAGGAFTLQGPGALQKGALYNLNYYVDVNGNGACDATPTDHVWRTSLPPAQENLTITLVHSENFSNLGCGGF
jgi:hypothetical protein